MTNLLEVNYSLPVNAYYLNLDTATVRRAAMEKNFGKLWGERLHRIPAVRGSDVEQVSTTWLWPPATVAYKLPSGGS
jgi:hypothetical protein